jgi:hypothetical protein
VICHFAAFAVSREQAHKKVDALLRSQSPSEFAKMFGGATVSGMADRFLFGFSSTYVKHRPPQVRREIFDSLKPVRIPAASLHARRELEILLPQVRRAH